MRLGYEVLMVVHIYSVVLSWMVTNVLPPSTLHALSLVVTTASASVNPEGGDGKVL
jgi:hypothetical protein